MTGSIPRPLRLVLALALALALVGALAGPAVAATPAWKLLAATGPTNLPPVQSETQRVVIEADGGTFTLTPTIAEGQGTLGFGEGIVETVDGSNKVHLYEVINGEFEIGQILQGEGVPTGSTIRGITGSGEETELELSNAATESVGGIYYGVSKEVKQVSTSFGQFKVGAELTGPGVAPGTTIEEVGSDTLTISTFPIGGGTVSLSVSGTTAPISYDAPASALQNALEAAGTPSGAVSVIGGPGGDAEHPYFLDFGGSFADVHVPKVGQDDSGLSGENANVNVFIVVPGGPGTGEITINPANIGGAETAGTVTLNFGPLPAGIHLSGAPHSSDPGSETCTGGAGDISFTCTTAQRLPELSAAPSVRAPVEIESGVAASSSANVEVSGGGAQAATFQLPIVISKERAQAGISAYWAGAFDANGNREVQAGGHAYSAQTYFLLNTVRAATGKIIPAGVSKNVIVDLPAGFLGNPLVTPRCPQAELTEPTDEKFSGPSPSCNQEMAVGHFLPNIERFGEASKTFNFPILNDVPAWGAAAEFSSKIILPQQSLLATVRTGEDYGIRITAPNNPNFYKIYGSYAALGGVIPGAHGQAFLTNPTDCAEEAQRQPVASFKSSTYESGGAFSSTVYEPLPPVTGCDRLQFHPTLDFQPTTTLGSAGTGAVADLKIPQDGLTDPNSLATPELKKAVVQLPAGLTLNPSSANGLEGCSEAQIGYVGLGADPNPTRFTEESPTCPDGSKIGTAIIKTPLLEAPLAGTVYLASQGENPFGSLVAIYLVVDDARTGITMKLPGNVQLDPTNGQVTATFDNNPQLPFEELTLNLRGGGPRSTMATPEVCGHYATTGSLTPWSAPESGPPSQIAEGGFDVNSNCASSAGARPFSPSFEAGTSGTQAGGYNPLVVKIARKDGEQELKSLSFTLPKGLIGKLAGIPYCPDASISAAEGKTGKAEAANSSCPAASQIGTVNTAAGVGAEPFHVGGRLYLAGPYKGAPVSSVVITPALAGPFDLGNVVVRAPLYIDRESAVLTAKSDSIPTILKGIPLKVRSVDINVDRPGFILNPTNCTPMTATASLAGGSGATASPSTRFQVGGCEKLRFAPKLKVMLKGGTRRNSNPALTAVLNQPPGQANIARVSVALPHSEFLEQGHIRTVCTRVKFAEEACPKGSVYGHAEAVTPLLDQPLRGPVYLRSSSHKLPDLVAALKGPASQPIEVDLDGRIDSVHGGIRTTFETVPDAPVSRFVLRMQGGKKSLLVNSTNICKGKHNATVRMTGQNALMRNFSTRLRAHCKRARKGKTKGAKGKGKGSGGKRKAAKGKRDR